MPRKKHARRKNHEGPNVLPGAQQPHSPATAGSSNAIKEQPINKRPSSTRAEITIAFLTLVILLTYATSDYFLWQQLNMTQKSVEITERPWASIPIAVGITTDRPLTFNSDQTRVESSISHPIHNSGKSPALNAVTQAGLVVGAKQMLLAGAQTHSPCDKNFIEQLTKIVGSFIAPGDTVTTESGGVHNNFPFAKSGPIGVVLQICVGYRDEFGHVHGTGSFWHYITSAGQDSFEPVGVVAGHWEYWGVGSVAY